MPIYEQVTQRLNTNSYPAKRNLLVPTARIYFCKKIIPQRKRKFVPSGALHRKEIRELKRFV